MRKFMRQCGRQEIGATTEQINPAASDPAVFDFDQR
jgi:hypothetical protein